VATGDRGTAAEQPVLEGERVVLRPIRDDDVDALVAILREPSVARWWNPLPDEAAAREAVHDGDVIFTVEVEGDVAGWLSVSEETDADFRHAGIDVFLTAARQDAGLGTEAVRLAVDWLIGPRGHHRVTIDPCLANRRAIRCYERVGFLPVGVMRAYGRIGDGSWADHLLLDLLARDVRAQGPGTPDV
jgi:aminoglycoside 6'-N-acetyltransferase